MSKYRITGPKIETIPLQKTKRKKSSRGIGLIVLGCAMFAGSLRLGDKVNDTEMSSRINELENGLEQPVTESNYRELITMQSEYDSLIEERLRIDLFGRYMPLLGACFGVGIGLIGILRNQKYRQPPI